MKVERSDRRDCELCCDLQLFVTRVVYELMSVLTTGFMFIYMYNNTVIETTFIRYYLPLLNPSVFELKSKYKPQRVNIQRKGFPFFNLIQIL